MLVHTASYTVRGECHQIAEFRGRDVEMQRNRGADGGYNGTSIGTNMRKQQQQLQSPPSCQSVMTRVWIYLRDETR